MIDFHSHILPGVDHGASSLEVSVEMMKQAKEAGVTKIVATSHFYAHRDSVDDFLNRRNAACAVLNDYLAEDSSIGIQIIPAAEVALESDLLSVDLRKLVVQGTKYILIEMPMFSRWHSWMYDMLYEIESKYALSIILAHVDRYEKDNVDRLLDMGFTAQINASSLVKGSFFEKRRLRSLCNQGLIHLIGSDAHDVKERSYQELITASRKLPNSLLTYFEANANDILK